MEDENRLLVRVSKRQESALKKYHDMKSELPHLVISHRQEINSLQTRLRRVCKDSLGVFKSGRSGYGTRLQPGQHLYDFI